MGGGRDEDMGSCDRRASSSSLAMARRKTGGAGVEGAKNGRRPKQGEDEGRVAIWRLSISRGRRACRGNLAWAGGATV